MSCSADGGIAVWNMDTQREEVCITLVFTHLVKYGFGQSFFKNFLNFFTQILQIILFYTAMLLVFLTWFLKCYFLVTLYNLCVVFAGASVVR